MSGRVGVNELPVGFLGVIGCFVRNSAYHSTNLIGQFVACTSMHAGMKLEDMLQRAEPQLKFSTN